MAENNRDKEKEHFGNGPNQSNLIDTNTPQRSITTRGRISEGLAAIAFALALILVVAAIIEGHVEAQVGQRLGIASILLFFSAFGIGVRQKSSLTTSLLIVGGGLYLVYLIAGTITMTVLFYYAAPNVFFVFLILSCIVLGLGLIRHFKRNPSFTIKARDIMMKIIKYYGYARLLMNNHAII